MNTDASRRTEEIDPQTLKIEVNLDDTSGELLGFVMEKLFEAGAVDVYYVPIYMKKSRPAVMLTVLCRDDRLAAIRTLIFQETTTLGLRYYPVTVHRLERELQSVATRWGEIRVKVGFYEGKIVQQAPEYEDCRRAAESNHLPLKDVYAEVNRLLEPRS